MRGDGSAFPPNLGGWRWWRGQIALTELQTLAFDVSAHEGSVFARAGFDVEDTLAGTITFSHTSYGGWALARFNEVYVGLGRPAFEL